MRKYILELWNQNPSKQVFGIILGIHNKTLMRKMILTETIHRFAWDNSFVNQRPELTDKLFMNFFHVFNIFIS